MVICQNYAEKKVSSTSINDAQCLCLYPTVCLPSCFYIQQCHLQVLITRYFCRVCISLCCVYQMLFSLPHSLCPPPSLQTEILNVFKPTITYVGNWTWPLRPLCILPHTPSCCDLDPPLNAKFNQKQCYCDQGPGFTVAFGSGSTCFEPKPPKDIGSQTKYTHSPQRLAGKPFFLFSYIFSPHEPGAREFYARAFIDPEHGPPEPLPLLTLSTHELTQALQFFIM